MVGVVALARNGDLSAQSELVRRYRVRLSGFVRPRLKPAGTVADVVQLVFSKMIRRLGNLRAVSVFEPRLFTLPRKAVLDHLRRTRCRPVTIAMSRCDVRTRNLLEQTTSGSSYRETAARERASIAAIKLRVHRPRQHLRENLRAD